MKKGIYAGAVIFSLITIIFFGVIAGKRIYSLVFLLYTSDAADDANWV